MLKACIKWVSGWLVFLFESARFFFGVLKPTPRNPLHFGVPEKQTHPIYLQIYLAGLLPAVLQRDFVSLATMTQKALLDGSPKCSSWAGLENNVQGLIPIVQAGCPGQKPVGQPAQVVLCVRIVFCERGIAP